MTYTTYITITSLCRVRVPVLVLGHYNIQCLTNNPMPGTCGLSEIFAWLPDILT